MYLYYTVASQPEDTQTKPSLSLGGYKSSNKVINSAFNNLFSDITPITVSNYNQNRYIGLILKNETGEDQNVKMWFSYPDDCFSKFRVAAVDLSADSDGNYYMEHIDNVNSSPLYVSEFYEADGEDNAVSLGSIASGGQIGIWIEMELLIDTIKASYENVYEKDPNNSSRYIEKVKETEEEIELHFSW